MGQGREVCLVFGYCRMVMVDKILPHTIYSTQGRGGRMTAASAVWVQGGDVWWLCSTVAVVPCVKREETLFLVWRLPGVGEMLSEGSVQHRCLLPCALASRNIFCCGCCCLHLFISLCFRVVGCSGLYQGQEIQEKKPNQGTHYHIVPWVHRSLASLPYSLPFTVFW